MPDPNDPLAPEAPKLEIIPETTAPETPEVVNVPATPEAPAPVAQKPGESNEAFLQRLKVIENQTYGNRRIVEGLQKQITELTETIKSAQRPVTATPPPAGGNFWDEVDPRAREAVKAEIRAEARALLDAEKAQTKLSEDQKTRQSTLEKSMEKVFTRYPNLQSEGPELDLWLKVVNDHPEWTGDPHGPLLCMQEMEELAPQYGVRLTPVRPSAPARPATPKTNGRGNGHLPPSRQLPSNTVQMTPAEVKWCQDNGLDPVKFKQTQRQLESGGGIEA